MARTESTWLWRLSTGHGSNGVLGDVGIHILDFAAYGAATDIDHVFARLKTFNKAPGGQIGEYMLDANDSFTMSVDFANGALGVVHAVDQDVGRVREAVGVLQVLGHVRAEGCERVAAVHTALAQVGDPAGADRQRAKRSRADQHEADAGVAAQAGEQLREGQVDLLEGHRDRARGDLDPQGWALHATRSIDRKVNTPFGFSRTTITGNIQYTSDVTLILTAAARAASSAFSASAIDGPGVGAGGAGVCATVCEG